MWCKFTLSLHTETIDFKRHSDRQSTRPGHCACAHRLLSVIGWRRLDLFNHAHAFKNFSKNNMTSIKPGGDYGGYIELRAICVFSCNS